MTGKDRPGLGGGDTCRVLAPVPIASFLSDAEIGNGNVRLGRASDRDAQVLGSKWVRTGARSIRKQGVGFDVEVGADGLRQFRSPSFQPNQRRIQANDDRREEPAGDRRHRGHLNIDATCP